MSQNHPPIPRLDLAPKLKRPLSLWNPLDYLRLLYWVFYFPQALRWYESTFGGESSLKDAKSWREKWEWLRQNAVQRQLILQALVLIIVILIGLSRLLGEIGISIDWDVASAVGLGVMFGVVLVGSVLLLGVASGVASAVVLVVGSVLASVPTSGVASVVVMGVTLGVGLVLEVLIRSGFGFGVMWGVGWGVMFGVGLGVMWGVASAVVWGMGWDVASAVEWGVPSAVALGVGFGVASAVAIARPENWLFAVPFTLLQRQHQNRQFPHITPLPLPYLSSQIANWLRLDWQTGLHNTNELLKFTLQFIPVVKAINRVLAETPKEQLIYRVAQLSEDPYDWNLVRFASVSLSEVMKSKVVAGFFIIAPWKQQIQARFQTEIRLNTPARASAAGFWYLHQQEPDKATEAFTVVRDLLYGEEMLTLAQILTAFDQTAELAEIASLQLPPSPNPPRLRETTWQAIASLRRVIADVQVVQNSVSRSARSLALNRALGQLGTLLNQSNIIPKTERILILKIVIKWVDILLQVTGKIGDISITQPVTNPYVIGDPVQGNLFVGREDIIRELEELWVKGNNLQSVALYGHRRMGKTSILLNATNCLGAKVQVAYVNLLRVGDCSEGVGELLIFITDAIAKTVKIAPPADRDLLDLPYLTFGRYIEQVVANIEGGLIIALDEFEKIEELIKAGKINPDFIGFLRGILQMSSKVALAFAGLHTLHEMTSDYFNPLFASIIPIRVGFLSLGATRQVLANPDDDFILDYKPEALDRIYELTHGQPYLTQLVGFLLVRHYNDRVFEMGRPRDPMFTVEDVETVINDPEFFTRGRYYFTGVWGQAAEGAPGQQEILTALAPHLQGMNFDRLSTEIGMDETSLQEALKTLERHDVVKEINGCYCIAVELFRRWVQMSLGGSH
ncbi:MULTISPECIES: ATP-binding protein [unclassified Microcoleus]|uniref:ATP-binding protein n=1 Tax=unclassified Microcoleus TaxID=2642155 RepID=UPI001D9B27EE|nr:MULTISPECIES: ATP-binding protein [unclassified Microcoleus]MCC3565155.1 ATP-binding protein [Microcoleus sp. PH2017_31_RDM_U_A]MCC3581921.1 ATP-binding protein [Microcoleus sp. PH2017_32_RDM_D_A]MCC3615415.1 ATP-binding protein [Microcoleus sp. PH2017_38_RDM_U_B]